MPELTKRDVLKALSAAGIAVGGAGATIEWTDSDRVENHDRKTLHAVAKTVYPSDLDGIVDFVDGFMSGRIDADTERADGIADAIKALDDYTRSWENTTFRELDTATRDETLRGMGVAVATPDPNGDPHERVRYYLVNELLFGLYSSPTGGELVGIENPQGHPGGTTSYRKPPE